MKKLLLLIVLLVVSLSLPFANTCASTNHSATWSVASSADDDVVYGTTYWSNTDWDIEVGYMYGTFYMYGSSMRFTGVNIPANATITVAYLTLTCSWGYSATVVRSTLCCESPKILVK